MHGPLKEPLAEVARMCHKSYLMLVWGRPHESTSVAHDVRARQVVSTNPTPCRCAGMLSAAATQAWMYTSDVDARMSC